MITRVYRTNRARFSRGELSKYQGTWVAFSADGCRIVASGDTLERVEDQIVAGGGAPEQFVLEWIAGPDDDSLLAEGTCCNAAFPL